MATFKAWAYTTTEGGIENSMRLLDRPEPSWVRNPPKGKYAIEVLAASLNPADYKIPESSIESSVVRILKPATPGLDFCGRMVSQPDRIVCGRLAWPASHGTLGQYVLVSDNDFVDKPEHRSEVDSAAIGVAALTAYQSLVPHLKLLIKARTTYPIRVVIFGGSGGVGTWAIQIAKRLDCYVVATCSSRNEELCRRLGADEVIDYTRGDVVDSLAAMPRFHLAIDNTGADPTLHKRSESFLRSGARFVLVSAMLDSTQGILSMMESLFRPRWLGGAPNPYSIVLCQSNKKQLEQIVLWVNEGSIEPVVDEVFEFDDASQAIAKLRTGRARGKIVVSVKPLNGR